MDLDDEDDDENDARRQPYGAVQWTLVDTDTTEERSFRIVLDDPMLREGDVLMDFSSWRPSTQGPAVPIADEPDDDEDWTRMDEETRTRIRNVLMAGNGAWDSDGEESVRAILQRWVDERYGAAEEGGEGDGRGMANWTGNDPRITKLTNDMESTDLRLFRVALIDLSEFIAVFLIFLASLMDIRLR